MHLHEGDLCDGSRVSELIDRADPDEIYHLGAQSHVRVSFDSPIYTHDVVTLGTGGGCWKRPAGWDARRRDHRPRRPGRAALSGRQQRDVRRRRPLPAKRKRPPFRPRSPYAVAKVAAYHQTVNYRESYGLFAANGILFNHESPRRGEEFVTRKITRAAGRIAAGLQDELKLGNLDARRDWGYAPEYVGAMWRMLQTDEPHDLVIATGADHGVREFLNLAFAAAGLDPDAHVSTDPRHRRPAEVHVLRGDATAARDLIGWEAETDLAGLVRIMVEHDLDLARREAAAR